MRVGSGFSVPWVILPFGPAILVPWHIVSIEYVHRGKFVVDRETRELVIFILVRLDFGLGMIWLGQGHYNTSMGFHQINLVVILCLLHS